MENIEKLDLSSFDREREIADLAEAVAVKAHEAWRQGWAENSGVDLELVERNDQGIIIGTLPPRPKNTSDEEWLAEHGVTDGLVDIANLSADQLPYDWKEDNLKSAAIATSEIFAALDEGRSLDTEFIEATSALVHQGWVARHPEAPAEQAGDFVGLSEAEKDKDRGIVRLAIKAFWEQGVAGEAAEE